MNDVYKAERDFAIRMLSAAVDTYRRALEKRIDIRPDADDAAVLTAYIQAETVLLRLLKEEVTDHGEGGGDHRRRVTRPVRK